MYEWRLCATVKQCTAIPTNQEYDYHLLLKLGTKFSNPLPAAQLSSSGIIFNANIELEFSTANCDLPASNLQILLVARENILSPRGVNTRKEQIMAIATLPITYPLSQSHAVLTRLRFDKPADSRTNIRVSFTITRTGPSPTRRQRTRSPSPSPTSSPTKKQAKEDWKKEEEKGSGGKMSIKREEWEQILKERNQLYKMSENLYEQLRKCMAQRDEYLRELRQKELSEQQIREELEFLKLKLQEDHAEHPDNSPLLRQIEELRSENEEMRDRLSDREADLRELERRVKQSLMAMDQFRRQAMSARTDLIHKESELSLISRQSKHLDHSECIQELYRELDNRRYEEPFYFDQERYEVQSLSEKAAERIKKQTAALFTQLIGKMKMPKDREWLIHEKVAFEKKLTQIFAQN